MTRILALALVLTATQAAAVLPPCSYDGLVAEATDVVQLTGITVALPDAQGYCALTGTVAATFRGGLRPGATLTVQVPCDNVQVIAGPTLWRDHAALAAAGAVELHLRGGEIAGHGAGIVLLPRQTKAPAWQPECPDDA